MNLNIKIKLFKKEYNLLDLLALIAILLFGIVIRISLYSYISTDYTEFLQKWCDVLRRLGFKLLGDGWYNYTPIYMYILFFISKLPVYDLYAIKTVSVIFDICVSYAAARATYDMRKNVNPVAVFGIVFLMPTIIANSAMWGQCDSIYVFFITLSLIYLLKENSFKGMLFFSIAFALKLQSVFFLPILILLFFLKKVKFWEFFLIPATYIVSTIPIMIAGRPIKDCLFIYVEQARGKTDKLSVNYPNIYYLLMNDAYIDLYKTAGVIFTMCVLLVLLYHVLRKSYANGWNNDLLLQTALVTGSIIMFLLPGVHERYGYMVDIFAVIYAFTRPKKFYVPMIRIFISFIAYQTYFVFGDYFPFEWLALAQIFLIYDAVMTLLRSLDQTEAPG